MAMEPSKEMREKARMDAIEIGYGIVLSVLCIFTFLADGRCTVGDSFFYNYQRNKFELEYKGNLFKIDNNVSADEIIEIVRQKISEVDLQLSY
jgi:hypothetical protein